MKSMFCFVFFTLPLVNASSSAGQEPFRVINGSFYRTQLGGLLAYHIDYRARGIDELYAQTQARFHGCEHLRAGEADPSSAPVYPTIAAEDKRPANAPSKSTATTRRRAGGQSAAAPPRAGVAMSNRFRRLAAVAAAAASSSTEPAAGQMKKGGIIRRTSASPAPSKSTTTTRRRAGGQSAADPPRASVAMGCHSWSTGEDWGDFFSVCASHMVGPATCRMGPQVHRCLPCTLPSYSLQFQQVDASPPMGHAVAAHPHPQE